MRIRSASSSSFADMSPPSPSAKRFFDGKKLNVETTLVAIPCEPNACAASSISGRPSARSARDRRRPAEEMDRHDRLRLLGDHGLDLARVEVQRRRVDVGEDRRGAAARDRLGGREERERRADHLVAGADAERVEREHERVGAVGDADRVLDGEVLGRLASNPSTSGRR